MGTMIPIQSGSFGKPIGIYTRYKVLEDATKALKSGETVYAGRAVWQETGVSSNIVGAAPAAGDRVYGLSKANKNAYLDEVSGGQGFYGSGKVTVVREGMVELYQLVFTDAAGAETTVKTWDDTAITAADIGGPLYADDADGTITNVADGGNNPKIGYLLDIDTTAGCIQVDLIRQ